MILVIMIMLSLLIKTDTYLFKLSDKYGWFVSLIMQITVGVGLFMNREVLKKRKERHQKSNRTDQS